MFASKAETASIEASKGVSHSRDLSQKKKKKKKID
jgi:hypothetical protein